jgi:hypothetical protein
MTSLLPERIAIAISALKIYPPLIRNSLLNDVSFSEEYGLKNIEMISLGDNGPSLCRSNLFDAIRAVLSGESSASLTDKEDRIWLLTCDESEGSPASLILTCDQQKLILPDFPELSGDLSTRIHALEDSASGMNLPLISWQYWKNILEIRPLSDHEFDIFMKDISDTPADLEQSIRNLNGGTGISVSDLVPNSRRYFERLVGTYDGSSSIKEYAAGSGRQFIKQLLDWRPFDGLLFSLFLSSHPALTAELSIDFLDTEHLEKIYEFLEKYGDPMSKVGALELGFHILEIRPEVEPFLLRLALQIRDDDVNGNTSDFKLFSALFVLVDGELSRTRCLSKEPPFYRRMASLAQAALIYRQLIQLGIDCQRFCDFSFRSRSEQFYMQSFADMRHEPGWRPDFADAAQIQANFIGRIRLAGARMEANLGSGSEELRDFILGNGETSSINLCGKLNQFLPGPLEGTEFRERILPDELVHIIEEKLGEDSVNAFTFAPLINLSLICNVSDAHSRLASQALKRCNYVLPGLEGKTQLLSILYGLANVAAIFRDTALASDVRSLVRRYRSDSQFNINLDEAVLVLLVAAASYEGIILWRDFTGEVMTELAFGRLDRDECRVLHSRLLALLHSVPELWVSCARAEAALQSCCYP